MQARVLRRRGIIKHHIFSFLWYNLNPEHNFIRSKIVWLTDNGRHIKFWKESWCGEPLLEKINLSILDDYNIDPDSALADFWHNGAWSFPDQWQNIFPFLVQDTARHSLQVEETDNIICLDSSDDTLPLKHAYVIKLSPSLKLDWDKCI